MKISPIFFVLAFGTAFSMPSAAPMKMHWIDFSYVFAAWNVCNNATGVCRTLGHWVYAASPEQAIHPLASGASFKLDDDQTWTLGGTGNYEAHVCNGACSNTSDASSCTYYTDEQEAQVWNWGYDAIYQMPPNANEEELTSLLPKQVCAKAFAVNVLTGARGELPPACIQTTTKIVHVPRTIAAYQANFMYSKSAELAHFLCTKDSPSDKSSSLESFCRLNVHNSWDVSVIDPSDKQRSTTLYKIDDGDWQTDNGVTFFEQKVKEVDGVFYHTFSWNLDIIYGSATANAPKKVCFKAWLQDRITGQKNWLKLGTYADYTDNDGHEVRCLDVCTHVTPFSYAPGYCA